MFLYDFMWPESWEQVVNRFHTVSFLIDFIFACVFCVILMVMVCRFIKTKWVSFLYVLAVLGVLVSVMFGEIMTCVTLVFLLLVTSISLLIISGPEIRSLFAESKHWKGTLKGISNKSIADNIDKLATNLETAVINMSRQKCGALITIETTDRISTDRFSRYNDFDSEVTPELIETIFYKGSPLHDGATIIREGRICRAGVIFDSISVSKAAMPGSLGSRHRAALGITESFDCVCITVSEETGSIHICQNGVIRKCYVSNFKDSLIEVLTSEK